MKISRNVFALVLMAFLAASFTGYQHISKSSTADKTPATEITWHKITDLPTLQKKQEKKVIVDIYTSWCKWCHVMDEKTFSDPTVIEHLNKNYYMVKFDAESKENLTFKGKNYNYQSAGTGRRGHHQLASALTSDQLSYPSFAVLNASLEVNKVGRGFKNPDAFLKFLAESEM